MGSQRGVGLLEPALPGGRFVALQVHQRQGHGGRGDGVPGREHGRGGGQLGGLVQLAVQRRDQGEVSAAGRVLRASWPCGGRGGTEGRGRRRRVAGPQVDGAAGGQDVRVRLRVPRLRAVRELIEQGLGLGGRGPCAAEVPGPAGGGDPDEGGGQPGGDLLIGGVLVEQPLGGIERAGAGLVPAIGQLQGRGHQQHLRWYRVAWRHREAGHLPQAVRQRRMAAGFQEVADGQLVDDDLGGQRPVADLRRVRDGLDGQSALLVPAGGALVQAGYPAGRFAPQHQAHQRAEQAVIAVPAAPEGLDEHIGPGQRGQGVTGLRVTGQLAGQVRVDLVQDAGPQHQVPRGGRLGVEHLGDQVAGDDVVLGGEVLDEQRGIGMAVQRQGGQPQSGGPALDPPGDELQHRAGQGDAVLGHQLGRFGNGEGHLGGADLGQLPGHPVAVQRQQRVRPRGRDQVQARLGVPQHGGQFLHRSGRGDQVQVIQDQDHRRILLGQDGRQPEQEAMVDGTAAGEQGLAAWYGHSRLAQRLDGTRPERPRPVVELVQRDPGHPPACRARGRPRGQGHRLARAGRAGHHRQRQGRARRDAPGQARPRDHPAGHGGRGDLGRQHRMTGRRGPPRACRRCHARLHGSNQRNGRVAGNSSRRSSLILVEPPGGVVSLSGLILAAVPGA